MLPFQQGRLVAVGSVQAYLRALSHRDFMCRLGQVLYCMSPMLRCHGKACVGQESAL